MNGRDLVVKIEQLFERERQPTFGGLSCAMARIIDEELDRRDRAAVKISAGALECLTKRRGQPLAQLVANVGHRPWRDFCALVAAADELEQLLACHAAPVSRNARRRYRVVRGTPFMGESPAARHALRRGSIPPPAKAGGGS